MAIGIEPTVEPLPSAPPAAPTVEPTVAPTEQPAPQTGEPALPDEILKIPAFQALFSGAPPALSSPIKGSEKRPEAKLVMKNKPALMNAGIGFYRSLSGDIGVLFNQFYLHENDVKEADKAGKLLEIAPPIDSVNGEVAKSGKNNPVMNAKTPSGPKTAPVPAPPQFSTGGGLPASAETKLAGARVKNLTPGAPTSGPAPGAGRVFNSIFKPTI